MLAIEHERGEGSDGHGVRSPRVSSRAELKKLTGAELRRGVNEHVSDEREVVLSLLYYLGEIDERRELRKKYGSLWDICVSELRMTRSEAFLRITSARLLNEYPEAAERLRDGRLTLSSFVALKDVLRRENAATLLAQIEGKSKEQVEEIVAALKAKVVRQKSEIRDVPPRVVPLSPELAALRAEEIATAVPAEEGAPLPETYLVTGIADVRKLETVSATQCEITLTMPKAFREEVEELRQLLSHSIPDGDLAKVVREAVVRLLKQLRKKKGLDDTPPNPPEEKPREAAPEPDLEASTPFVWRSPPLQHADANYLWNFEGQTYTRIELPESVRREVWRRARGRCQALLANGKVCGSTWQCQVDHIRPIARGGTNDLENLRLVCRAHNLEAARELFGSDYVDKRIEQKKEETQKAKEAKGTGPPDE